MISLSKGWLSHPWIERWLPDHLRPVDEHIFSDAHGLDIVLEMEQALDRLIQHAKRVQHAQQFKKNTKTFRFRLKVNRKRMKLLAYETPSSEAAIKKRIIIEYLRKGFDAKKRKNPLKRATVQYLKNGQTYIRSIKHSSYFHTVFYKLDLLDDALSGRPISTSASPPSPSREKKDERKGEALHSLVQSLENKLSFDWRSLDNMLTNRLTELLAEMKQALSVYSHFDIEERYMLKRMLQQDIPSLIETYLSLSKTHQQERFEKVYEALVQMEISIRKLRVETERVKVDKMDQLLKLTEKRYKQDVTKEK